MVIKTRYLEQEINELCFAQGKMAFVSGPRQCGKTTMAKSLLKQRNNGRYFNWDETKFRRAWAKDPSQIINENITPNSIKPLIVLDEIHKAKLWSVYDTLETDCDILVTGSAMAIALKLGEL